MDKNLFSSNKADTRNKAGGKAYSLSAKEALAQYSATCMFGNTYYATAEEQLSGALALANQCEPEFVAKCAVYARKKGYLKDMPAFLLASLAARGELTALRQAWPHVIDNGKMLRNFAQVVRSGVTGRKSFGTAVKRLISTWLQERNAGALFRDSVGANPSLADVIKMTHPKPGSKEQVELFKYIIGKPVEEPYLLPKFVQEFENWKVLGGKHTPDVPFQLLSAHPNLDWFEVAKNASWTTTRMNLNTFARHGVLKSQEHAELIANKLRNPEEIKRSKCYPYQLLTTFKNCDVDIPMEIQNALQDAMEIATANTPNFDGRVVICPDVSGSMRNPVSGNRPGATSKTTCVDVAALMAAVLMRKCHQGYNLMPFSNTLYRHKLNHRDSIMTLAQQISNMAGGGTDCSLPLRAINEHGFTNLDAVIYISDNESWLDGRRWGAQTSMMDEFRKLQKRVPDVKLVCVDLTPNTTTQAPSAPNRLNVGGFSDSVFDVIANFLSGESRNWVDQIERVVL